MKRFIIFLIIIIPIVGASQNLKKGEFVGRDKQSKFSKYLYLNNDGTFLLNYFYTMYHNPISNGGEYNANGLWEQIGDTIILNTYLSREDVLNIDEKSTKNDSLTFIFNYEWNVHHPIQLRIQNLNPITLNPGDTIKVDWKDFKLIYISFSDLETTFIYNLQDLNTNTIVFSHTKDGAKLYKLGIFKNCRLLLKGDTLIPLTNLKAINVEDSYVRNKGKIKKR